ncbi:AMP-binding protein [Georgenia thermotolerans]|uniref:AMP-binding protein n=1 Tax=Georgenia thermotolerans TaxID=527326 RepID=A0A7J5UIV0_9MICO|nr:AMP-binding protein [Georgenia thermotolerans]KAE8762297.1 AMP-binding protein [Georgenia thermotolerans]
MSERPAPERPAEPRLDPVLAEYTPFADAALTDAERWPTLTAAGAARLTAVREHPRAPAWVHACGDRLTAGDVARLDRLHDDIAAAPAPAAGAAAPEWVDELLARAARTVPHYRRRWRGAPPPLAEVPPISRAHLARALADFVPLDVPLADAIAGTSSGSTGAAVVLPQHPVTVAADLVQLRRLVTGAGRTWRPDPARVAVLSVVAQETAFTYGSVLSAFEQAAMARITLHPAGWRRAGDREAYLAWADPQVITSTPLALLRLAELDVDLRPLAVVSGATALAPATRAVLEERWAAPVLDVYGLVEAGPLAASGAAGEPHRLLPRRVHVEVLDADGAPVPVGGRGEVVVTADENPYLPLLRYRTGDTAVLGADGALHALEGRAPVRFRHDDGTWVDAVSATQLLQAHGARAWQLHQDAAGALRLDLLGGDADGARKSLRRLLGRDLALRVLASPDELGPGKPRRFSSDLPGGTA